jgi:hypothetical protein
MFDTLVEQRIRAAQESGEFDDLPGAGAPLALDDDALVPEDLRVAYRLLKNAGFVPPELEAHREIRQIEELLRTVEGTDERNRLLARIEFLLSRATAGRAGKDLRVDSAYYEKIADALARRRA